MKRKYLFLFVLIISSFVYSQKATTLKHLIQPKNIHVDADRIFITDYPEIHIYSTTDYKLLKTFGGKGQGPGEFFLAAELPDTKEDGLQIVVKPGYYMATFDLKKCLSGIFKLHFRCYRSIITLEEQWT